MECRRDITKECEAKLEFTFSGGALVYLFYKEIRIGLFDKKGFYYITGLESEYEVDNSITTATPIIWFKVYKKHSDCNTCEKRFLCYTNGTENEKM